jgi:hypothetical protein
MGTQASCANEAVCIEYFPRRTLQPDLTWMAQYRDLLRSAIQGILGHVQSNRVRPPEEALSVKICQRMHALK